LGSPLLDFKGLSAKIAGSYIWLLDGTFQVIEECSATQSGAKAVLALPDNESHRRHSPQSKDQAWLDANVNTIKGNDRTLTLHRWVAHLELRRRLRDGAGGIDLWIGELRVETHGAAMDYSCGSGKAIDI